MTKVAALLGQREHLDEVPAYVLAITDTGEKIKYVPERTSEIVDVKEFEYEWDAWCEGMCSCGEWFDITHWGIPNYCRNCGARIV